MRCHSGGMALQKLQESHVMEAFGTYFVTECRWSYLRHINNFYSNRTFIACHCIFQMSRQFKCYSDKQ